MNTLLAAFVALSLTTTGLAVHTLVDDDLCAIVPHSAAGDDTTIRVEVVNRGDAIRASLCVRNSAGNEVAGGRIQADAGETWTMDVPVYSGDTYEAAFSFKEGTIPFVLQLRGTSELNPATCERGVPTARFVVEVYATSASIATLPARCTGEGTADAQEPQDAALLDLVPARLPNAVAAPVSETLHGSTGLGPR